MTLIKLSELVKRNDFKTTYLKSNNKYTPVQYTYTKGTLKPYFKINHKPLQIQKPIKHIILQPEPVLQTHILILKDQYDNTLATLNLPDGVLDDVKIEYLTDITYGNRLTPPLKD